MGRLTTHVLDVSTGQPGHGIRIELFDCTETRRVLATVQTNADGRVDQPLLEGQAMSSGVYELVFHVGDYFRQRGIALPEPAFVDQVVLRFGVADAGAHYHVPLLVTPWSYSTYRGS